MTDTVIDLDTVLKAHRTEAGQQDGTKKRPADAFYPAYSDPNNEFRGSKYDATRDLPLTEVCKRIRQDIKDAIAGGRLPGLKVSVRQRESRAVTLTIKDVPASFRLYTPDYLAWAQANPMDDRHGNGPYFSYYASCRHRRMTPEYDNVLQVLSEIVQAYNRDNSDTMTDYFDVRFYKTVEFCWELERRRKDEEMAALPV